jgi:Zn-dependent protease/CBS domain-containing protein
MKRSIKLITILGIPVEINYSWFIIFALIVYTLSVGYFPLVNPEQGAAAHWSMGIVAALLLFICLLAHELSHSYVAKMNGLSISGITLFVFGGVAHMEKEPTSPDIEFKMAIAGPLMSFLLGALFWLISLGLNSWGSFRALSPIADYLVLLNFAVGFFNLIPGFPLDGGRVLRSLIWKFSHNLRKATLIASSFGKTFAYLMIGLGFLGLITGNILSGVWFIFLGLFLQEAAESSYRQVVMKKVLSGARVGNLMSKNVIVVPAALTLDQLVENYFFKYRFTSFPVIEDDTLLGLVTFHDIKEIAREEWPTTSVRDILIPLNPELLAHEQEDLMEAMVKLARNGVGRLLVVEDSKLIGILSQRDILRLFEFKEAMGE